MCSQGQSVVRTSDLSQMCIFETMGKHLPQHLGRILCYQVAIIGQAWKWWRDQPGCKTCVHGCVRTHQQTHVASILSGTQMLDTPVQRIQFFFFFLVKTEVGEELGFYTLVKRQNLKILYNNIKVLRQKKSMEQEAPTYLLLYSPLKGVCVGSTGSSSVMFIICFHLSLIINESFIPTDGVGPCMGTF